MTQLEHGKITVFDRTFDLFGYANDTWYQGVKAEGNWNEFSVGHLSQLVAPTDICLDIGANVGTMTLALAMCASQGRVYAFEASPTTTVALQRTIEANGLHNVSAHHAVVGRASQEVRFIDVPEVRSSGFYLPMDATRSVPSVGQDTFEIASETKSVDQIVSELGILRVNFLKIDVEGAELDVLAGAANTIARFRPHVLVEFNSYALVHLHEIIPRRALATICAMFEEVYYFQDRAGFLVPLPKNQSDLDAFLHNNLLNGCVDDLLCTFRGAQLERLLPKGNIQTRLQESYLSKVPARTIMNHLRKRIARRLRGTL